MRFTLLVIAAFLALSATAFAQPRPSEQTTTTKAVKAAPSSVQAKYEGGMFGYGEKESGTLKFDDANSRLVFYGMDQKERFGIPYAAVLMIYPDQKSVTSTAGNVIKWVPLPGAGLAGLIKEKRRYLVLQYDDPDVDAKGTTSFKLDNKELLESVLYSLGTKANLKPRGEAYIRPRPGTE
jgi:hypothetical protein